MNLMMTLIWAAIEAQLRQAEAMAKALSASGASPAQQRQLLALLQALSSHSNQSSQLQGIYRQRYETRVGELMGMAASAGLDWKPPGS